MCKSEVSVFVGQKIGLLQALGMLVKDACARISGGAKLDRFYLVANYIKSGTGMRSSAVCACSDGTYGRTFFVSAG